METHQLYYRKMNRMRSTWFLTGICITMLITAIAFEWRTASTVNTLPSVTLTDEEIYTIAPVTFSRNEAAPATKPQLPKTSTMLAPVIVPDGSDPNPVAVSDSSEIIIPIPSGSTTDTVIDDFLLMPEIFPEFPGSEKAMLSYLSNNIKYPQEARRNGISGIVFVNFIVDENGKVTAVECLRSPHQLLTEEAMRVIKTMPTWRPGMQGGKKVKVKMSLPVNFRLL